MRNLQKGEKILPVMGLGSKFIEWVIQSNKNNLQVALLLFIDLVLSWQPILFGCDLPTLIICYVQLLIAVGK